LFQLVVREKCIVMEPMVLLEIHVFIFLPFEIIYEIRK